MKWGNELNNYEAVEVLSKNVVQGHFEQEYVGGQLLNVIYKDNDRKKPYIVSLITLKKYNKEKGRYEYVKGNQ